MDYQHHRITDLKTWLNLLEAPMQRTLDNKDILIYLSAIAALVLLHKLCNYISQLQSSWQCERCSKITTDISKPEQEISTQTQIADCQSDSFGKWKPSAFQRPPASPYLNWSHLTTAPLPYRPFRYGPTYHTTMGLRKMDWNEWIELDNGYLKSHADKRRRIEKYGAKCCRTDGDPRAFEAAVELLEDLSAYLCEHYPSMFQKTRDGHGIMNVVTNETFNVKELTMNGKAENPMQLCARLVQDDIDILFERGDGQYYLGAAGDFLSGIDRLEERMGMSLSQLHTSSNVPYFEQKLEKGMMSFFRRLKPENPIVRHNYFIQVDEDLEHSIYGGDGAPAIGWDMVKRNKAIGYHWFRSERQTLRRLPRSGGVVFTIRTYLARVTDIVEEPGVAGRLASAVRSWDESVGRYKGREKYEGVLLEYLDRKCAERKARGLDGEEREEDRYPW